MDGYITAKIPHVYSGHAQTRSRPYRGRAWRLARRIFIAGTGSSLQGFGCAPPPCSLPAASPPTRHLLPLAPSNRIDAASGWRSHAAVLQHSGPFQGGGRSPRARPGYQMQDALNCIIPLAVVAAPLHTPWGRHYLVKL